MERHTTAPCTVSRQTREAALRGRLLLFEYGALGGTRTHGLSLRRAALYPLSYQRA
jgi:hypothetical protein